MVPIEVEEFLRTNAVLPSTLTQYQNLWRRWQNYCAHPSSGVVGRDVTLQSNPAAQRPGIFASFIVQQRTSHSIKHDRISGLVAAMKHHLIIKGADFSFLHHPLVDKTLGASKRLHDSPSKRYTNTGSTKCSPVTWDMIQGRVPTLWSTDNMMEVGLYIACCLAFHLCLRVSEYAASSFYEATTPHGIRSEDVIFEVEDPFSGHINHITSMEWTLEGPSSTVKGALISIRTSKTDQRGVGSHHRLGTETNPKVAELVNHLSWWATHTSLTSGELFFRFRPNAFGSPVRSITRRDISEFLKKIADQLGLDRSGYSSHSLRVGGAEALKSSGFVTEDINQAGRWSSSSTAAIKYRSKTTLDIGALSTPTVTPSRETDISRRIRMEAVMQNNYQPPSTFMKGRPTEVPTRKKRVVFEEVLAPIYTSLRP
eukprot:gene9831-20448_t